MKKGSSMWPKKKNIQKNHRLYTAQFNQSIGYMNISGKV